MPELDRLARVLISKGFPRSVFTGEITLLAVKKKINHKAQKGIQLWLAAAQQTDMPVVHPWLYIYGAVGSWKTAFATLFSHELLRVRIPHRFISSNNDIYFFNSATLFDHLQFSFNKVEEFPWEKIKESSLLVIDDFGTEPDTLTTFRRMYELINYRYENCPVVTIITSNLSLQQFVTKMAMHGKRLASSRYGSSVDAESFALLADRIYRRIETRSLQLEFKK